jgi:hypothetical protein
VLKDQLLGKKELKNQPRVKIGLKDQPWGKKELEDQP